MQEIKLFISSNTINNFKTIFLLILNNFLEKITYAESILNYFIILFTYWHALSCLQVSTSCAMLGLGIFAAAVFWLKRCRWVVYQISYRMKYDEWNSVSFHHKTTNLKENMLTKKSIYLCFNAESEHLPEFNIQTFMYYGLISIAKHNQVWHCFQYNISVAFFPRETECLF